MNTESFLANTIGSLSQVRLFEGDENGNNGKRFLHEETPDGWCEWQKIFSSRIIRNKKTVTF